MSFIQLILTFGYLYWQLAICTLIPTNIILAHVSLGIDKVVKGRIQNKYITVLQKEKSNH